MAQNTNTHIICEPASAPVRGMRSAVSPAALPAGYFSQLTNLRFDELQLKVRYGAAQLTTAAPVDSSDGSDTPQFRGSFSGSLQGTEVVIAAYQFGTSATLIFSLNTSTYAWTEISSLGTSSANGNTRMTVGYNVCFTVVKDQTGKEILVCQNGNDQPRIYDPSLSDPMSIHQAITPPNVTSTQQALLSWPTQIPIWQADRVGVAYENNPGTTGTLIWADTGTADNLAALLTIGTSVASGNYSVFNWEVGAPAVNFSTARQLIFLVNTTYQNLWNNIKITLKNEGSGVEQVVYDPSSSTCFNWPIFVTDVDPNNANTYAVAFSLDGLPVTTATTTTTAIWLTWVGTSPPASTQTCTFFLMAASGVIEGGAEYGIAYRNSNSRAESFGQFLTTNTASLQAQAGTPNTGLQIPNSELLYYDCEVSYQVPSAAQIEAGVDTLDLYRMDAGELQYTLADSVTISTFSGGSWNVTNAGTIQSYDDSTAASAKNLSWLMPDAYNLTIPVASSMVASNGRLFVGGVGAAQADVSISQTLRTVVLALIWY